MKADGGIDLKTRHEIEPEPEPAQVDLDFVPQVAGPQGKSPTWILVVGLALLAAVLFAWLNGRRLDRTDGGLIPAHPGVNTDTYDDVPPAPTIPQPAAPSTVAAIPAPQFSTDNSLQTPPFAASDPTADAAARSQRLAAPAVVVDLTPPAAGADASGLANPAVGNPALATAAPNARLNADETFAQRVSDAGAQTARASAIRNLSTVVPQGAVIHAVLETAIDSDLPGYARAVVARDVRSFDGQTLLIPRGSRVIGQYKSAMTVNQSRALIIWTRIIRPDGVSVQLGSPGTDTLGRNGLDGKVDRHFFNRFGGSMVMSAINAGAGLLVGRPAAQINIGGAAATTPIAGDAGEGSTPGSSTIKVKQGALVNIFVARDLDFTGTEPYAP